MEYVTLMPFKESGCNHCTRTELGLVGIAMTSLGLEGAKVGKKDENS